MAHFLKKLLTTVCAAVMLCVMIPVGALAQTDGDFSYTVTDGEAAITAYHGTQTTVVIPDTLDGYAVTAIASGAFQDCVSLESIMLPEGLQTIGDRAFMNCASLNELTMPDSVTVIGEEAFCMCYAMTHIAIPNSVQTIGAAAFELCQSLESVALPDGITTIEAYMFAECESLVDVTIPDSVTTIERTAISGCRSLTEITLPDSVSMIEVEAFAYSAITDVYYVGTKQQWQTVTVQAANEPLTDARIHYGVSGAHWRCEELILAPSCTDSGLSQYTCDCGYTAVLTDPAVGHDDAVVRAVQATCTGQGYTLYQCRRCERTEKRNVIDPAHTIRDGVCIHCALPTAVCLASDHNYANNTDKTWAVRQPGATAVKLVFASETETDDNFDFIEIYDGQDRLVGRYTGKELAGVVVKVSGEVAKIRLTSDDSMVYYGFAVAAVSESCLDSDGDGALDTSDARIVLRSLVETQSLLTAEETALADMDGDGGVTTMDVRKILLNVVQAD